MESRLWACHSTWRKFSKNLEQEEIAHPSSAIAPNWQRHCKECCMAWLPMRGSDEETARRRTPKPVRLLHEFHAWCQFGLLVLKHHGRPIPMLDCFLLIASRKKLCARWIVHSSRHTVFSIHEVQMSSRTHVFHMFSAHLVIFKITLSSSIPLAPNRLQCVESSGSDCHQRTWNNFAPW